MHEFCHRCGEELATGDSSFCQHCGAPQLRLPEQEAVSLPEGAEDTTGILPPPRPQTIDWRMAILCAAAVAVVAAVLTGLAARVPVFTFVSWLWTVSGAAIALSFYQKRRPEAWMDAKTGARIGIVAGLALIVGIAVAMAIAGVVARYGLHAMGPFDAELKAEIERAAAMNPQPTEAMRFVKMPEFRAGVMLGGFAMMAGLVMIFSMLGGAMSGMMRMRRS